MRTHKSLLVAAAAVSLALFTSRASAGEAGCPPVPQMPTAEQMQQAQAAAKDRGALWKLSKDGRVSYLYGTVHVGNLAWSAPGPLLKAAVAATEVVAVEVNMTDPAVLGEFMAAQGAAPKLVLTADEQARLDAEADAACVPRAALAALHPVMQAMTYVVLAGRRDGLDPAYAQEAMLIGAAQALKRPVVSLETVSGQMAALLPSNADETRALLLSTLDSLKGPQARAGLRRVGQAWEEGDLESVSSPAKLCDCVPSEAELKMLRRVNDERNPGLAARIDEEHGKGKPVLAAVGLLHMTGPLALPRLLQERGFGVERLR